MLLLTGDNFKLRPGRKVGRTIYVVIGDEASDSDLLIGMFDHPEIATEVCRRWNAFMEQQQQGTPPHHGLPYVPPKK